MSAWKEKIAKKMLRKTARQAVTMAQQQGSVCVPHPFTQLVTDAKHGLVTLLQTVVRSFPSAVQCSPVCSMTAVLR